jgi:hypothetical protein
MIKKNYSLGLAILSYCFFSLAYANPSPFGITIKETSIKDLKQKYSVTKAGINKYSQGKMYNINPSQVEFDGLNSLLVIFGPDEKALAVLTNINKNQYDKLYGMLSTKYKLVSKKDAFVGDKKAEFIDDQTKIILNAPHLSFNLELYYIHKDFDALFMQESENEEKEKKSKEKEKL